MKRLVVLGFAILALGTSAFASSETLVAKLNEKTTLERVVDFADIDFSQKKDLQFIFNEAVKRYNEAMASGISETEAQQKAVSFNVANAKIILNNYQFKKFLQVINEINNESSYSVIAEK